MNLDVFLTRPAYACRMTGFVPTPRALQAVGTGALVGTYRWQWFMPPALIRVAAWQGAKIGLGAR